MNYNAKIREAARQLVPMDNLMFRKMAEDKFVCQEILRVIMDDPLLVVMESTSQCPVWFGSHDYVNIRRQVVVPCILS